MLYHSIYIPLPNIQPKHHRHAAPLPFRIAKKGKETTILFEIIPVNLITHHHHPQQKHAPDNIKRKRRLPIIAQPLRLQPRQRRLPVHQPAAVPVEVAVEIHTTRRAVELDTGFYKPGEEEYEEDEGAEEDDAGEELALRD